MSLKGLFHQRYPILIGSLFILVYCNLYGWLFVPFTAFDFSWRPDHQLHVHRIEPDSIAAPFLQRGDRILTINGRTVHRSATYFPPTTTESAYELTIQRGESIFVETVPFLQQPDSLAYQ